MKHHTQYSLTSERKKGYSHLSYMHKSKIKGAVGLILHTQNNKKTQKPQNKTNNNITKNNCSSRSHEICEDKDLRSALKKELSYSKKESYEYWVACASQPGDGNVC